MKPHRTAKSHVTAWVLVVVAAPVLYVFTMPVVALLAPQPPPAWLVVYTTPFTWLMGTPLRGPLKAYMGWMIGLLGHLYF
jgi:hypothetical protein